MNSLKNAVRKSIPKKITDFASFTPDKPHQRISYALQGEDLLLDSVLGFKKKGFYVDIGAHHPFRFSNTYLFYQRGWTGINIDPLPNSMKLFEQFRPLDTNLEIAVSNIQQPLTYYMFEQPAFNTFSQEEAEKRSKPVIEKISVQTYALAEILDEYIRSGQSIDFLDIDTEGLEISVLNSNDWSRYRPNYILAEDLGFDYTDLKRPLHELLQSLDYQLVSCVNKTLLFSDKTASN